VLDADDDLYRRINMAVCAEVVMFVTINLLVLWV